MNVHVFCYVLCLPYFILFYINYSVKGFVITAAVVKELYKYNYIVLIMWKVSFVQGYYFLAYTVAWCATFNLYNYQQ